MLNKLSYRNARRQAKDYLLYFITMIISAALLYAFNALVFSDILRQLSTMLYGIGTNVIGYIIIFMSILSVIVLGWLVSYMMNVFLRKRSKEFGTYMLLGVEKKQIVALYVRENCIFGLVSLLGGWLAGLLLSEFLEAVVTNIYGNLYSLSLKFSIKAAALTIIYFVLIYVVSLFFNRRRIKKMRLIDLLSYEKHNETSRIRNNKAGIIIFIFAILCGAASILLLISTSHFAGVNPAAIIIISFILIALCQYGVFMGVTPVISRMLASSPKWKYKGSRLFLFRNLANRVNSISISLGSIATVMVISLILGSLSIASCVLEQQKIDQEAFDITILYLKEDYDFSPYADYLSAEVEVTGSHSYYLYTQNDRSVMDVRNKVLGKYFSEKNMDYDPEDSLYYENRYDSYIRYSDYCILRDILGLEHAAAINDNQIIIHCLNYLEDSFEQEIKKVAVAGQELSLKAVYTEPFSQYSANGNGQDYLIVIPDRIAKELEVQYSLYAATTNQTVGIDTLTSLRDNVPSTALLETQSVVSGGDYYDPKLDFDYMSRLPMSAYMSGLGTSDDLNYYVGGISVSLLKNGAIATFLPVLYLVFILMITGAVILAVQYLTDSKNNHSSYQLLGLLGLDKSKRNELLRRQVLIYFALPVIPVIVFSLLLDYTLITKIPTDIVAPVSVNSHGIWIAISLTMLLFILIFFLYAFFTYVISKKNMVN